MRSFRDLAIKPKLILITVLTSAASVLLGCAWFAYHEQQAFRRNMARDFAIIADMFDDNVAQALAFEAPDAMAKTLATLSDHQHIVAAGIFDRQGRVVARFERPGARGTFAFPAAQPTGQRFLDERLDTFQDITLGGETIGEVYISSDLDELHARIRGYVFTIGGLLAACSLAALALASRLQAIIARPIVALARTAAIVTSEKNYSIRAPKEGDDEVGRLVDGFNEMLQQIQLREAALQESRDLLERRVAERTAELRQEIAERRQADAALATSEERFATAFEYAATGMALVSLTGQWMKVNRSLCELLGYSAAEMLARTFQDITHPDDLERDVGSVRRLLTDEIRHYVVQKRYLHKDGHAVWVQLSVATVRDAQGRPLHFSGQVLDIGPRKRAEAELAGAQRQLLEMSRRAGKAEVATHVLHNVGNALNSVNVSAGLVADSARNSRAPSLAKVAALLREHQQDLGSYITTDPKGQHIPAVVEQLAQDWAAQQQAMVVELATLTAHIDHIKQIVAMQQGHVEGAGVTEVVEVAGLVEESLRAADPQPAAQPVQLVRVFAPVPPIAVDKHKVLQILANLVRNARRACDDGTASPKHITLGIAAAADRVRISVGDDGVGIAPENLTRIFSQGFTTRRDGHGFGLHSGALAAAELGGSLSAHSDGVGRGATFALELPLHAPGARA